MVKELNATDLSVQQALQGGGTFSVVCTERQLRCRALDGAGNGLPWAWQIVGGARLQSMLKRVTSDKMVYEHDGVDYELSREAPSCSFRHMGEGCVQIVAHAGGEIVLNLDSR